MTAAAWDQGLMTGDAYRIGVDIGGTFTDFVLVDRVTGEIAVEKVLTTPQEPQRAVMDGILLLARDRPELLRRADAVIHATTLLTNVVLERKGARCGLLTTAGFRDVLEIGREIRYDVFDPYIRFAEPVIPRALRQEVPERVLFDGSVRHALDEAALRTAIAALRDAGVEAVAVSFLHAYANPAHELRTRDILAEEMPGVAVSISSEVHPEPREYERTSTTVIDAYVKPVATRYLRDLEANLAARGYGRKLFVMQSNGGTATAETGSRFPVQLVESGPAAGVEAAGFFGRMLGHRKLLSFDMGGTTAKLCLLTEGQAARTRNFEVDRVHRFKSGSGIPVAIPVFDLLEIGAGGGSIARIDGLGLLQVGPASAGSVPGPACYGRGGTLPTVTDADLVLGYLDPDFFLGGAMKLSAEASRAAVMTHVAAPLGLTVEEAALGIQSLVNETMASAARVYVAEKGETARGLSLVAFGGAGPGHAIGLARKLGCAEVIVPPMPGVMSAFGLLVAPIAFERARARRDLLREADMDALATVSRELEQAAAAALPEPDQARFERTLELRLVGQEYPLEIAVPGDWRETGLAARIEAAFHARYEQLYGRIEETPIELVTLRVKALQPVEAAAAPRSATGHGAAKGERQVYFQGAGWTAVPVFARAALRPDETLPGPAVIEERESTLIIGPADRLSLDRHGCLHVMLG